MKHLLTHTPTSLPEHTKNAILELFETGEATDARQSKSLRAEETAVATQPFLLNCKAKRQPLAYHVANDPKYSKKTLLTTQYLKTGLESKSKNFP